MNRQTCGEEFELNPNSILISNSTGTRLDVEYVVAVIYAAQTLLYLGQVIELYLPAYWRGC